jgi:hypothetical protein
MIVAMLWQPDSPCPAVDVGLGLEDANSESGSQDSPFGYSS